jgi:hypothetical protein
MGYVFSSPPDAPNLAKGGLGYQLGFSMDSATAQITATTATYKESAMQFMTPPNPRSWPRRRRAAS